MNRREESPYLTPEEVNALFRAESPRFAYRAAIGRGFLRTAARRFARRLLFDRLEVQRIIEAYGGLRK